MQPSTVMQSAYWIVLAPFLVGAFIILAPFLFPKISRDSRIWKAVAMALSIGAVLYGSIHSLLIFRELAAGAQPYVGNVTWFQAGARTFTLTMGILIDNLTAVMLMVVTMVSLLVQIYTHGYMREDQGYSRFYAYLSLFTGSMLGLVVATNLFQMFFFWELVGVCSYFLIGFWWFKPSAAYACFKAFVVNRIGDFGFLVGILMLLFATWGFWSANPGEGLLAFSVGDAVKVDISHAIRWALENNTLTVGTLTVLACLMFMGPMAKSAQFPLHVWLPDAMEGPTPISALIHAATMVAAGVYMVARAYPIWLNWADPTNPTTASTALAVVAWVGGFTAFMAATIALTQNDIKRALAWSTVSQLGYMFVGLGVGGYTGGMFHLFTHAFFKAMLFLGSGAVIHALHGEQNMQKMGGLSKELKYTFFAMSIGCLAISGFPGMSGFFSKDEIIGACFAWKGEGSLFLGPLMVLTAGLTAFYMFRILFMTFFGSYRGEVHPHAEHKPGPMTAPLLVLAVPSLFAGVLGVSTSAWMHQAPLHESPFGLFVHWPGQHLGNVDWMLVATTVTLSVIGGVAAWMMYGSRTLKLNETIATNMRGLYEFSLNRWYMDEVYHKGAAFCLSIFRAVWTLVDSMIIDDFDRRQNGIVHWVPAMVRGIGIRLRKTETGNGQYYALVIIASVCFITLYVYFTRPGG